MDSPFTLAVEMLFIVKGVEGVNKYRKIWASFLLIFKIYYFFKCWLLISIKLNVCCVPGSPVWSPDSTGSQQKFLLVKLKF